MTEYQALVAYIGVAFAVFIGAIVWNKYRRWVKRHLDIRGYQNPPEEEEQQHPTGAAKGHVS